MSLGIVVMAHLILTVCVRAQSCTTLCDPMDSSPPGSSVHGILQATGVGCHFLLQGIFLTQGLESLSLMSPALAGFFTTLPPGKPIKVVWMASFLTLMTPVRKLSTENLCLLKDNVIKVYHSMAFPFWEKKKMIRAFTEYRAILPVSYVYLILSQLSRVP